MLFVPRVRAAAPAHNPELFWCPYHRCPHRCPGNARYLQEAESAYKAYTQYCEGKDPKPSPGTCAALLPTGTSDESWQEFESAHTHALFFLAQCCKGLTQPRSPASAGVDIAPRCLSLSQAHRRDALALATFPRALTTDGHLGQPEKSAEHCHLTLQRQLLFKTYGPLDWAINAAGLSQYYLQVPDYVTSSHCLCESLHHVLPAVAAAVKCPGGAREHHRHTLIAAPL